jgi:hypothetical protein
MSFLPPTTSELKFITDPALRESLQIDISTANSAFSNGEWKASTVLAGSTLEALLLWLLEQETDKKKISAAVKTLVENGKFRGKPSNNHDEWSLHHYITTGDEVGQNHRLKNRPGEHVDARVPCCRLSHDKKGRWGRAERPGTPPARQLSAVTGVR